MKRREFLISTLFGTVSMNMNFSVKEKLNNGKKISMVRDLITFVTGTEVSLLVFDFNNNQCGLLL